MEIKLGNYLEKLKIKCGDKRFNWEYERYYWELGNKKNSFRPCYCEFDSKHWMISKDAIGIYTIRCPRCYNQTVFYILNPGQKLPPYVDKCEIASSLKIE